MNELQAWAIFGSGVLSGVIATFILSAIATVVLIAIGFIGEALPDANEYEVQS